jgi:hypothetical protein
MKRFSLGLAAVTCAASLTTYAALPTDAAPFQVNIPNLTPGIEVGFTGYALRPSSNDEDYAVVGPTFGTIALPTTTSLTYDVQSVDPDYDWAFAVMLGYIFPCSGNDIRASWIHFDNSDTTSTVADGVHFVVGPIWGASFAQSGGFSPFTTASATEDFKYDAVDLDVGQFVNMGTRLQARLFAGLRYAHIERNLDDTFNAAAATPAGTVLPPAFLTEEYDSKFDGIGPLFGVDTSYHLGYCFGLVAHADLALLVGTVKTSDTFTQSDITLSETVLGTTTTSISADDLTRVVPGFDGKLGLDWTYPFTYGCNCDEGEFSIEAGYQWTYYIDAVDRLEPDESTVVRDVPTSFDSVERVSSDIGFDGPYVTLSLKI